MGIFICYPTFWFSEATCRLRQVSGTTYLDVNTDTFLPGETVSVNCHQGYWFFFNDQQTQKTITCTESGKWISAGVIWMGPCQGRQHYFHASISCRSINILRIVVLMWTNQIVSILQLWLDLLCFFNNCNQIKVNQISLRKCPEIYIENYVDVTEYDLGKQSWTTINSHWDTIVLLYSVIRCQDPNDPNLKERLRSTGYGYYAYYRCKEGFRPTDRVKARCTENGWTPNPLCEGIFMGDFYWYVVSCIF